MLIPLFLIIGTVAFMEFVAWYTHKYIMHGWAWSWHKSHHVPHDDKLEKNDLFAVVFAGISIALFYLGANYYDPLWWIAIGMTLYGLLYFVAHDGLVHQRWPFRIVPKGGYAKRIYQAHRLHHAVKGRDGCVSFGFLWAPAIESLKRQLKTNRTELKLDMYESEDEALSK
ncbi:MAG: sterol desaturase family protein [Rhizobiaceae bacterium]